MKRIAQALTASLLGLGAGSTIATQACKPVTGHFLAHVVAPGEGHCPDVAGIFCTAGQVSGGIQGGYQFVMTSAVPSAGIGGVPTILFFTGQSKVFLQAGDQVFGTDTGSLDLPPGLGGFASLITFTSGTGGMSGASGQIRLRGEFDAAQGTTNGDYTGSVCAP